MSINYKEIGANIRVARTKLGMKQSDLAELVHVSTQHISHVECGSAKASLILLVDIANTTGTSVDALLGRNQTTSRRKIIETQFSAITESASDATVELCYSICKCIVEWQESH